MAISYSTPQAAKLLNASEPTIRNYCLDERFSPYLSAGANPAKGSPRSLTAEDLTILAFIRERTSAGDTYEQVAERLAEKISAGELAPFEFPEEERSQAPETDGWGIPRRRAQPPADQPPPQPAPLAIMAQTLTAELAAARERERQAQEREQQLWDRLIAAETARAHAEGELAALHAARAAEHRPWWKRLTGG